MKMTQEIARLIHKHDELETQVVAINDLKYPPADCAPMLQTAAKKQDEIRTIRLRLAAQGFWMFSN